MTVTAVRNDMWQDDERRNCWFSNDRTFYCVEMSTSYEHRSRLDDPPFATQVSSKKAFSPLTCDRSPILRSTHAAPAALVAKFASGNDFRDEASKISYVPRSSKIVTAQSKFTKEFAASVAQHIAHGKESHNTPLAGADVGVINEITKSRAHSKLVRESQENSFVSMQAPLTRVLDLLERTRKIEGSLKQYKFGNAPLKNSVLRLEHPVAMGNDGFRPYRDTGALIPAVDQTECPFAMLILGATLQTCLRYPTKHFRSRNSQEGLCHVSISGAH